MRYAVVYGMFLYVSIGRGIDVFRWMVRGRMGSVVGGVVVVKVDRV